MNPEQPPKSEYVPNRIPGAERFINILYALFLVALCGIGLFRGELLLPGRRTSGPTGAAVQGVAGWVILAAMVCGICVLLSSVVDHYDRRNNEASYRRFARIGKVFGWSLFVAGLVLHIFGR